MAEQRNQCHELHEKIIQISSSSCLPCKKGKNIYQILKFKCCLSTYRLNIEQNDILMTQDANLN